MPDRPIEHCYWVVPGKLLAGEYPGHPDREPAAQRVAALVAAGVTTFIDLTKDGELEPYASLLAAHPGVAHQRHGIVDVSVPRSREAAAVILDAIDAALCADGVTYVHCWGGVGRTGVIIGCWLARHGTPGKAALARLQQLWLACPKSASRRSPETSQQDRFVLDWREPPPSPHVDRCLGSLCGLAAGDALGTTIEFKRPGSFTPLTDIVGGGPFGLAPGQWTDDTSMALCLAESLLACRGFDAADQLRRYVRWWHAGHLSSTGRCFDIGTTCSSALSRFVRTGQAFAGSTDAHAAGNGCLMRLAPVPLAYAADAEQAIRLAGDSARATHGAATCVDACRCYAGLIVGAVRGVPRDQLLSPHWSPVPGLWAREPLCAEVDEVAAGSFHHREPPTIAGTGYVVRSLEAALWALARAKDFADGARLAVNLGDDADTTGAVYGQLAGAIFGLDGIPAEWREKLAHRELLSCFARGLAAMSAPV